MESSTKGKAAARPPPASEDDVERPDAKRARLLKEIKKNIAQLDEDGFSDVVFHVNQLVEDNQARMERDLFLSISGIDPKYHECIKRIEVDCSTRIAPDQPYVEATQRLRMRIQNLTIDVFVTHLDAGETGERRLPLAGNGIRFGEYSGKADEETDSMTFWLIEHAEWLSEKELDEEGSYAFDEFYLGNTALAFDGQLCNDEKSAYSKMCKLVPDIPPNILNLTLERLLVSFMVARCPGYYEWPMLYEFLFTEHPRRNKKPPQSYMGICCTPTLEEEIRVAHGKRLTSYKPEEVPSDEEEAQPTQEN